MGVKTSLLGTDDDDELTGRDRSATRRGIAIGSIRITQCAFVIYDGSYILLYRRITRARTPTQTSDQINYNYFKSCDQLTSV